MGFLESHNVDRGLSPVAPECIIHPDLDGWVGIMLYNVYSWDFYAELDDSTLNVLFTVICMQWRETYPVFCPQWFVVDTSAITRASWPPLNGK